MASNDTFLGDAVSAASARRGTPSYYDETAQRYDQLVTDDVMMGDKTVAGMLTGIKSRVAEIGDYLRTTGDIAGAVARDRALQQDIGANADDISMFRRVDLRDFPSRSATASVQAGAAYAIDQPYLNNEIQLPDGNKILYSALRDPERLNGLQKQTNERLNVAGYSDGVAPLVAGDTSKFYATDDPKLQSSNESARRLFGFLVANDLVSANLKGINARGVDDEFAKIAKVSVSSELAGRWRTYYNTFGDDIVDLGKGIMSEWGRQADGGVAAGEALKVALELGQSYSEKGVAGRQLMKDTLATLRGMSRRMRISDGVSPAPTDNSVSEQLAAVSGGIRIARAYGIDFDPSKPSVARDMQKLGDLYATLKDADINPTALMRDAGIDVKKTTGEVLVRVAGAPSPRNFVDVLNNIVSDRQCVGTLASTENVQASLSTSTRDHSRRERGDLTKSHLILADAFATDLMHAKWRNVATYSSQNGVDREGALDGIDSNMEAKARYYGDLLSAARKHIPGTVEERDAAAETIASAMLSRQQLPLVEFAQARVSDSSWVKEHPAAASGLARWLSSVGADDAEFAQYTNLVSAHIMSQAGSNADRLTAASYTTEVMDIAARKRALGQDYRGFLQGFLGSAKVYNSNLSKLPKTAEGTDFSKLNIGVTYENFENHRGKRYVSDLGWYIDVPESGPLTQVTSEISHTTANELRQLSALKSQSLVPKKNSE